MPPTPATLRPLGGPPGELVTAVRRWWEAPDGPLVVRTSGSTGAPKDVQLSHRALAASASSAQQWLGGPGQWLLALPPGYVAGLSVLVRSALAGTTPVVAADHGSLPEAVAALTADRAYISLVPTQVHRLAATGSLPVLRRFAAVLVGGAALPADLAERCAAEGVRVVRTYGMSETCGGCVYDGGPLAGVHVRLGAEGRVHLSGPVLFDGYPGDPAATARVLRAGELRTPDVGQLDHGRLVVTGRVDDIVVSGAVNVSLPAVTEALLRSPGIVDAMAVGIADAEWGTRVVACVVVAPGAVVGLSSLRDAVTASVPRTWAPRALVTLDAIPRLVTGKADRSALAALAAAAPQR